MIEKFDIVFQIVKKIIPSYCGQQTAALNSSVFWPGKTGRGGQMKTVGSCSIDVLDSKNDFGVSAPPGEK